MPPTTGLMTSILGTIALIVAIVTLVVFGTDPNRNATEGTRVACRAMYKTRAKPIFNLSWSLDGRRLAASGFDQGVRIWEPDTGRLLTLEGGTEQPRFVLGWTADGHQLVLGGLDVPIEVWDVQANLPDENRAVVRDGDRMDNARLMALATRGATMRLWGLTDRRKSLLPASAPPSNSLAVAPDGQSIASGGSDGVLRIWDVESGREKRSLLGNRRGINSVAFSQDGLMVAAGGVGPIRIWEVATGRDIALIGEGSSGSVTVSFSPDGRRMAGEVGRIDPDLGAVERPGTGQDARPCRTGALAGLVSRRQAARLQRLRFDREALGPRGDRRVKPGGLGRSAA